LLLIFGFRVVLRTIAGGTFFCPDERADRPCLRRAARRWFTLFFVPVIPLGRLGGLVQCESCRRTFPLEALDAPTTGELSRRLTDARRTAIAGVLTRRGAADPAVRRAAVSLLARELPDATESWVDADLHAIGPDEYEAHVAALGPELSVAGREGFLADLAWLARSGGPVDAPTRQVLERIGAGLGMTPAHVRGVLTTPDDGTPPGT
jgi:hypothetical protein